jgi:hypothetical protein
LRSDAILQLQVQLHATLQQLRRATSSLPAPLRALLRVPRSYTFSSFFYAKLAPSPGGYCYQQVQRWTRPEASGTAECVLRYVLLLFPINLSNTHWWVQGVLQACWNGWAVLSEDVQLTDDCCCGHQCTCLLAHCCCLCGVCLHAAHPCARTVLLQGCCCSVAAGRAPAVL